MTVIHSPASMAAIEEMMRAWREDGKVVTYPDLVALRSIILAERGRSGKYYVEVDLNPKNVPAGYTSWLDKTGRGYVVANAQGDQFRAWEDGPCWTRDLKAALMFARRFDAEEFARDDEDVWKILAVWFDKTTAGLVKRPL